MKKNDALNIIKSVQKQNNFSFIKGTTYGCGGTAAIAYFPKSIRQAIAVYDCLSDDGTDFVILGNGSNILASDKFFDGAVICTKNFRGIYRMSENTIFCRCGTSISSLLKYCIDNGFGGLEYLAGIPASIGGVVYMNAGAGGLSIGNNVVSVKLYNGKILKLSNKSCDFGHKYSIMRDIKGIILGAELRIIQKSAEEVRENISAFLEKRRIQPKGKSCGCVFKNAGNLSAGKIIDDVGLKGLRVGSAQVSYDHANFIINNGESSADVYALIQEIKRTVFEHTGITLEEEVVYIGDFNDTFC